MQGRAEIVWLEARAGLLWKEEQGQVVGAQIFFPMVTVQNTPLVAQILWGITQAHCTNISGSQKKKTLKKPFEHLGKGAGLSFVSMEMCNTCSVLTFPFPLFSSDNAAPSQLNNFSIRVLVPCQAKDFGYQTR